MQKIKKGMFLLTGCLLVFCLSGSSRAPQPQPPLTDKVVTDDAGRAFTMDTVPQRIVSLAPATTEILFAIGCGPKVVGVTNFCNYPAAALEKPGVGGYAEINIEQVAALSPDLVLADSLHMPKTVQALEELGIKVALVYPRTMAQVLKAIELVGKLVDAEKQAQALVAAMQQQQQQIIQKVQGLDKPVIFWELSADLWTCGPGSFIDDLITAAGGINAAAAADSSWIQLNAETLIAANPAFIFLADHPYGENTASVAGRPGWDTLDAVVNHRIIEITDVDLVSRPGPRVMDALEYLARTLHPEVFK